MHINFKGNQIDLVFGLRTLTEIDKALGFELEGANLGEGLEVLIPKLSSGNLVGVAKVIKAATSYHKQGPKSDEDLEKVLDDIATDSDYKTFGSQVIEELGKRPMTANLVPENLRKEKTENVKAV